MAYLPCNIGGGTVEDKAVVGYTASTTSGATKLTNGLTLSNNGTSSALGSQDTNIQYYNQVWVRFPYPCAAKIKIAPSGSMNTSSSVAPTFYAVKSDGTISASASTGTLNALIDLGSDCVGLISTPFLIRSAQSTNMRLRFTIHLEWT